MPSKTVHYSSLSGKGNSDKEYQHVLKIWNKSEMKPGKDYHDLYLKCDVLLLADKKFRNRCPESYGLCSSHYLCAPILSWDAMLSMTKVKLDLVLDFGMYLLFEKGMRVDVSYICKRYSKAKNKYSTSYDPKKPTKHITYLDKNNLYCYAMSKFFQQADLSG